MHFMAQLGERLVDNGYSIIPIMPGSKIPGCYVGSEWRPYSWRRHIGNSTRAFDLANWSRWPDHGIGIVGGAVVGIDIDVVESHDVAYAIEQLARQRLGDTPCMRIGLAPKRMLIYRTKAPFPGIKRHPIEALCEGQQFLACAIHPDTGRPYQWPAASVADTPLVALPEVTQEQVQKFLDEAYEMVPDALRPASLTTGNPEGGRVSSGDLAGTPEAVESALECIPNADLDYDSWIKIGHAIKGALGNAGVGLWLRWSAQSSKNNPATTEGKWFGFDPKVIGAGSIYFMARARGWQPGPEIRFHPEAEGPHPAAPFLAKIRKFAQQFEEADDDDPPPEVALFDPGPFPKWVLDEAPGILGDMVRWIVRSATHPQPELALLNSIVAMGALTGRRYRSPRDTRTNVFAIGVAGTASGKDHSRKKIKALFTAAGLKPLLMGDRVQSGAGVLKALAEHPSRITHIDEIGMHLQQSNTSNHGHATDLVKTLLEVYGASNSEYLGNEYADPKLKRVDITQPHLCIYGTTTLETLVPALSSAFVSNGALNRFVVIPSTCDYPDPQEPEDMDPPQALVDALRASYAVRPLGAGNLAGLASADGSVALAMIDIGWDEAAKKMLGVIDRHQRQQLMREPRTRTEQLWGRLAENAIKLAMIHAVAVSPVRPVMTEASICWGAEIVGWSIVSMEKLVHEHVADNRTEEQSKRLLRLVKEGGPAGITNRDLIRATRSMEYRAREETLRSLIEGGLVVRMEPDRPKRGLPSIRYRAR